MDKRKLASLIVWMALWVFIFCFIQNRIIWHEQKEAERVRQEMIQLDIDIKKVEKEY